MQLIAGFLLGGLIAYLAWRVHALNLNGALAATITGGLIFGLGGIPWAILLLIFFISSSALSRAFAARKIGFSEKFSKGSQRDWGQVLANGSLGALLAIAHFLFPAQTWPWIAFVGAMAAVNADTWATELGVLSPTLPRLITSGKIVESGTSGGISALGTIASIAGATLVGTGAALFTQDSRLLLLGVACLGGLAGSLFDSLLGATVQAIFYCPACKKETERHPLHLCGCETQPVRGWRWMNNDVVNFGCSLMGGLVTVGFWYLLV